jgi:uncharacterized protein (DUF433 family)
MNKQACGCFRLERKVPTGASALCMGRGRFVVHPNGAGQDAPSGLATNHQTCPVQLRHNPFGICRLVTMIAPKYSAPMKLLERITVEPGKCGGRPCIRGMRIRVTDILGMLAEGVSHDEILKDFPYLEPDDIKAALAYAARQADHAVLQPM